MQEIHTAQIVPIKVNPRPVFYWRFARDNLYAAKLFRDNPPDKGFSPVSYDLCCFSIELSLKAFLLSRHHSNTVHVLPSLLKKAKEVGVDQFVKLSSEDEAIIIKANELFRRGKKGISYSYAENEHFAHVLGAHKRLLLGQNTVQKLRKFYLPDLHQLFSTADKLVIGLEKECLDRFS